MINLRKSMFFVSFAIALSGCDAPPQTKDAQETSPTATAPADPATHKSAMLKLLSEVTTPMAACGESSDRVLAEIQRMKRGKSDALTVYSAAQAAVATCDNASGEFADIKLPAGLLDDERAPIAKALDGACPAYPHLVSAAWTGFSRMMDSQNQSLADQYSIKQSIEEANASKVVCIAPMVAQAAALKVSDQEFKEADHGV